MLTAHGVTNQGHVRTINEDYWAGEIDLGFFIVADGMGGHNAGEVASRLAVEAIRDFLVLTSNSEVFTWPYGLDPNLSFNGNRVMTSLKLANRCVFKEGESRDDYTGMGTTVVVVLVDRDRVIFASVGDSRLYSFVDDRLQQLTRDDSWLAEVLAREPAVDKASLAHHPMRHVLTNVIGARSTVTIEVTERPLVPGEMLLLCSDGLHGAVDDHTIASILADGAPLASMAERLIDTALDGAATDNITAVLVQCEQ